MNKRFAQRMPVLYLSAVTMMLSLLVVISVLFAQLHGFTNLGATLAFLTGEIVALGLLVWSFAEFRRKQYRGR